MLVEHQVGDQALEAGILLAHLPQLAHFRHTQAAELLLPQVERRLGNPHLPADIADRRAALGQPERVGDLLFRVPGLLHRASLPSVEAFDATLLYFSTVVKFGANVNVLEHDLVSAP